MHMLSFSRTALGITEQNVRTLIQIDTPSTVGNWTLH